MELGATAEVLLLTGGGALSATLSEAVKGSVSVEELSGGESVAFAASGSVALRSAAFSGTGEMSWTPAPRFATPFSCVAFRMHTRGWACDAALSAAGV